ncbi:MAG: hypothetical protein DMG39_27170 [Acidobacteria bacterium]|nr:MAG: hypothetical protein DMG39_27170 [Acidobacteriota bacterium]
MVPFKEFVLESIRQPNGIYLGKRDPTRRIYRKSYLEVPGVGNSLDLLVFLGDDGKHVATAYFAAFSLENVRKVGLAFNLVQKFEFDRVAYNYDRSGDVLDVSFGPPAPAVAVQVEDWLAIRMTIAPPYFQGITIVGFRKIFEKLNRYVEKELPKRMKRLARTSVEVSFSYDDQSDTLIIRRTEQLSGWHGLVEKFFRRRRSRPTIFESLSTYPEDSLRNVYVEKTLPSKEIVGVKILEFTKVGPAAIEGFLGAMIDSIFEPGVEQDENAHLIANVLIANLDWSKLGRLVAS